jgi:hypothetical protein
LALITWTLNTPVSFTELALYRLGKIVVATEELGNEVLFGRLGARGLQRIPSKGNDPMDPWRRNGSARCSRPPPTPVFRAPGRRLEIDGLGRPAPGGVKLASLKARSSEFRNAS